MKIIFTDKKYNLNISLNKAYEVLGYYTDWVKKETLDWHKIVLFLDDNKMPQFVNATYLEDIIISGNEIDYPVTEETYDAHKSVMPEFWNLSKRNSINEIDLGWWDLRWRNIWAITQFTNGLKKLGIEPNEEFLRLTESDETKIWYIKGIANGLFESVCNFFACCSNAQYHFELNKYSKNATNIMELANKSFNSHYQGFDYIEKLQIIDNWKEDLYNQLYQQLVYYSDFGIYMTRSNEDFLKSEANRNCLKGSIKTIVLTMNAIIEEKEEVKVHKLPLDNIFEYALIFETDNALYQLYLGNWD